MIHFLWAGTKEELTNCLNNLNENQNSIKFEYKILQTSLTLLKIAILLQKSIGEALTA